MKEKVALVIEETDSGAESVSRNAPEELSSSSASSAGRGRRVLFLDDDIRRAEVFLALCPEAVWVETARACIDRLAEPWDEVHLDHDLGGERYVDVNRDDCGMAVVRWLCAEPRPHLADARFFIHSHHLAAASLMVQCLLQAGHAAEFRPFGYDLVDLLAFEEASTPRGPAPEAAEAEGLARRWRRRVASLLSRLRRGT